MLVPSPKMAMMYLDYDQVYTSFVWFSLLSFEHCWPIVDSIACLFGENNIPSHIFSLGFYRNNKPKYLGCFYIFFLYCFKFKSDTSPEEGAAFIIIPTHNAKERVM